MIAIDPTAPTEKEQEDKKLLKPRYMIWRESLSSSQELGFRIEAIKVEGKMSQFHCYSNDSFDPIENSWSNVERISKNKRTK